ncbi:hypothetical protein AMQ84_09665 [Paenibacillus riograndensis]|uniref:Uncharacterized protein n=1 Tax=Paenibacillus riograndensis TaxID=483937 RepID=A0A132U4D1_9BACL|nr:hypothetical protein AMQ84_09665 [Paenibacillus riograndensis]
MDDGEGEKSAIAAFISVSIYPTCFPSHFLQTASLPPEGSLPKYKSLILVLPQIGQVPLLREGVRHKALPRLFLDIFCSTFALDILSYAQIEGGVKGDKERMEGV